MNMQTNHYRRFLIMIGLHFIAMYMFMYSMVDAFNNVFNSFNQIYMAALMTASMILIELPLMSSMYKSKRLNAVFITAGVAVLIGSFLMIREQVLISDRQFLRSMIPHHAGAILMCEKASIQDREIQELCKTIVSGQQAEIDLMKRKLEQLAR